MPAAVLEPPDAGTAASMLARASNDRIAVVPRGSGTKLSWSAVPTGGAYLSTRLLRDPVEHYSGDLVATIPSGATLAEANAVLARAGQWLPLDPTHADRATIGGVVATNDSGPRRHKYGSPRDLIIGIEVALTDGRLAKAGGRVVKNVAGYDLSRLLCGSFGSLAVITSATFKLAPIPAASRTVLARLSDVARAAELALTVAAAPMTPSAIEIEAPAGRLMVRFETTGHAVDQMATAARAILENGGASTDIVTGEAEQDAWWQHEGLIWGQSGVVLKASVLPTDVAGLIAELDRAVKTLQESGIGLDWSLIGRAALGVLLIRLDGKVDDQGKAMRTLRRYAVDRGGSLVTLEAPSEVRSQVDESDDGDAARAIMSAVKAQFDPRGTLPRSPGT